MFVYARYITPPARLSRLTFLFVGFYNPAVVVL